MSTTKSFKGKAIYNPSGKAGEYSYWACNFYVGCSNNCSYCYCKKGILAGTMGQNKPQLKKCFWNEEDAIKRFRVELGRNLVWEGKASTLLSHGLFFSFTTDPMLPETIKLTMLAVRHCLCNHVPVKILTKCVGWVDEFLQDPSEFISGWSDWAMNPRDFIGNLAFGFTYTGHDDKEPGASTNAERIAANQKLHDAGFKTYASIEPVIDFESSLRMVRQTAGYCDHYKIGLLGGAKYVRHELHNFMNQVSRVTGGKTPLYFKDSLLKAAGIDRESLPKNCVERNFNLHTYRS